MCLEDLEQPGKEMAIHRCQDGFIEEAAKFSSHKGAIDVLRNTGAFLSVNKTQVVRERGS